MASHKKDDVQRTKSNPISLLSIDALAKNLVSINNNKFDSEMNDLVLVLDSEEMDYFFLNDLLQ